MMSLHYKWCTFTHLLQQITNISSPIFFFWDDLQYLMCWYPRPFDSPSTACLSRSHCLYAVTGLQHVDLSFLFESFPISSPMLFPTTRLRHRHGTHGKLAVSQIEVVAEASSDSASIYQSVKFVPTYFSWGIKDAAAPKAWTTTCSFSLDGLTIPSVSQAQTGVVSRNAQAVPHHRFFTIRVNLESKFQIVWTSWNETFISSEAPHLKQCKSPKQEGTS